jgi:predicted small secreted protein
MFRRKLDCSADASDTRVINGGRSMRKLIVLAAAAAALLAAACNTVAGVGKDVQAAGHAVSTTAEDAKH